MELLRRSFIVSHFHFLLEQISCHYEARCSVFHSQPVPLFAWANLWHSTSRHWVFLWAISGENSQSISSQSLFTVSPLTEDHNLASKRFLAGGFLIYYKHHWLSPPSQRYSLEIVLSMQLTNSPAYSKLLFCYIMTIATVGTGVRSLIHRVIWNLREPLFFPEKILSNAYRQSFSYSRPANLTFILVWDASLTPSPWTIHRP